MGLFMPENCHTCKSAFASVWGDHQKMTAACYAPQTDDMFESDSCATLDFTTFNSADEFCALMGACPSQCEYCEEHADVASGDKNLEALFCHKYNLYYGIDEMACKLSFNNYIDAPSFCSAGAWLKCSNIGSYQAPTCRSTPNPPDCVNGQLTKTYSQSEWLVTGNDEVRNQFWVQDMCAFTYTCKCAYGFKGSDCSEVKVVEDEATVIAAQEARTAIRANQMSFVRHKSGSSAKLAVNMTAKNFREGYPTGAPPSCDGSNWAYYDDSDSDGVSMTGIGLFSAHETCGMAIKQDSEHLFIAINTQLFPEGQVLPTCTVSLGDMFINFEVTQFGKHVPIPEVNGRLWAIKHDESNDSPFDVGLYNEALFKTVAPLNAGFATSSAYVDEIAENNGFLHMGGGIDTYDEQGIGYLGQVPLNSLENAAFVDTIDVAIFDHWYADDMQAVNDLGLEWTNNGGNCDFTRLITVPRQSMPHSAASLLIHNTHECFNDVFAARFDLCEVPSVTPTISTTPSRSSTPSISITSSPAPDTDPYGCTCFNVGEDSDLNTLSLGDFTATSSDTEGRLGVCGNAVLTGYSIGSELADNFIGTSLAVEGNLTFNSGEIKRGVIEHVGTLNLHSSVYHGLGDNSVSQVTSALACDTAKNYYPNLSLLLQSEPAGGTTTLFDGGTLTLERKSTSPVPELVKFDVNCELFADATYMKVVGVAMDDTLIVNLVAVNGSCAFDSIKLVVPNPAKTVYNLADTASLRIKNVDVQGAVLAPLSDVTARGGVVNGQSIVASWTGVTQQNLGECKACLPFIPPSLIRLNARPQQQAMLAPRPQQQTLQSTITPDMYYVSA